MSAMRVCARRAIFLLRIEQIPFYRLAKRCTFLKRVQNQFKMFLEMFFVLASIVSTEKCESLDGYVTTSGSTSGCGKCGAWLFCSQSCFYVTRPRKNDKNKLHFFFALFINVPFQSIKYRKKELGVDNKVRETIGDVYCQTFRNEKCVYISTNETSSFYDYKKCKARCHVLNIPFKDLKPTIMLFGGDGRHCFAMKTSRDFEKRKPSPFLKKFLRQSQSSTPEPEPKKANVIPFMA